MIAKHWIEQKHIALVTFRILAHLCWKFKWFSSDHFMSGDSLTSLCISILPYFLLVHFRRLLQNHWANFNNTWHKKVLGLGNSSLLKWGVTPCFRKRVNGMSDNFSVYFKHLLLGSFYTRMYKKNIFFLC